MSPVVPSRCSCRLADPHAGVGVHRARQPDDCVTPCSTRQRLQRRYACVPLVNVSLSAWERRRVALRGGVVGGGERGCRRTGMTNTRGKAATHACCCCRRRLRGSDEFRRSKRRAAMPLLTTRQPSPIKTIVNKASHRQPPRRHVHGIPLALPKLQPQPRCSACKDLQPP